MNAKLGLVSADRLIAFVRSAFPAPSIYGDDTGGDATGIIRFMQNEDEMARIAEALWNADYEYKKDTRRHFEAIRVARDKREIIEAALRATTNRGLT